MPYIKIDMIKGRTPQEIKKLADVVQEIMLDKFAAPARDRYQVRSFIVLGSNPLLPPASIVHTPFILISVSHILHICLTIDYSLSRSNPAQSRSYMNHLHPTSPTYPTPSTTPIPPILPSLQILHPIIPKSNPSKKIINQHEPYEMICEDTNLGFERTDKLVFIQIFQQGRDAAKKQAVYAALAERLEAECGVPKTDLIVTVSANTKEDWSFGMGRAQFLTGDL